MAVQPSPGGRADTAELPVPAKCRGPDLLAFRRLRAQVARHRQWPGHDVVAQPAKPFHVDLDDVPRLHRARAGRGAGQQHVPRVQRDGPGDVGDQVVSALLDPTINSYKRFGPDTLAPWLIDWGLDNRSAMVRIPPERGAAARMEVRLGDATANPYHL
jgi:hypothetical protein